MTCAWPSTLHALAYAIFFLMGFGPFAVANSLWTETPFLARNTPEGEAIGAYIGAWYNGGNVLLLLYFVLGRWRRVSDFGAVCVLLALAVGAGVLAALAHGVTGSLGALRGSVFVWLASLMAGTAGCILVLTLFSYAHQYPPFCTSAMATGLAFSGILISLAGNAQVSAGPDHSVVLAFSFETFMLACGSAVAGLSLVAVLVAHFALWPRLCGAGHFQEVAAAASSGSLPRSAERQLLLNAAFDETPIFADVDASDSSDDGRGGDRKLESPASLRSLEARPDPGAQGLALVKLVAHPILCGVLSAACSYFYNPGLPVYLSDKAPLESALITAYQVGATTGAFATSWIKLKRLTANVYIMAWILLCLIVFAVAHEGELGIPDETQIGLVGLLAFFNGYNTTQNYLIGDQLVDAAAAKTSARQYIALGNQAGVLIGTYSLTGFVALNIFVKKLHE